MKNFMLLIREDLALTSSRSEEEMQAEIDEYTRWVESLSAEDLYVAGDPLAPEGRLMTGEEVQSDGPFIESKEAVTGYILIKARDLDHAVELSRGCPVFRYGGQLEVRPVFSY
ncbi:YciI family protein [Roseivirga sp. BDSF3-8]|uniref:YciI family protein n=1 Tax=Roseivirga sp. BDSF3-8 TaxID=3241598 RepID=UPI0035322602